MFARACTVRNLSGDWSMNAKAKGSRAERRCVRILTEAGYHCFKAGGSLGALDVSAAERRAMEQLERPSNATREYWHFADRCNEPRVERIHATSGARS
jgi:hypothetical protein